MTIRRLIVLFVAVAAVAATAVPRPAASEDGIQVYFSPDGGCTDAIIQAIEGASESVQVQAYSFTSAPIAEAILGAHKRGVDVTVVLDSSQRTARYSWFCSAWLDERFRERPEKQRLVLLSCGFSREVVDLAPVFVQSKRDTHVGHVGGKKS